MKMDQHSLWLLPRVFSEDGFEIGNRWDEAVLFCGENDVKDTSEEFSLNVIRVSVR